MLEVSLHTYIGWENGESLSSSRDLQQITTTFQLSDTDTDLLFRTASQVAPRIQNFPFARNPLFTGRENGLLLMSQLFKDNESVTITQPVSVSGLGGIGKTQLALEYAHHSYPNLYRSVLWVNAADKATLEASYLSLAQLLQLPEKNEREVDQIVQAVKLWLEEHTRWLLILDNADDLELVRSFLPTRPGGRILLTMRSQIVGNLTALIQIEAMLPEEGLLFLLRRSGFLPPGTDLENVASDIRRAAAELVELLAGHPLALDEEPLCQEMDLDLLSFNEAIQALRRYSLVKRDSEKTVLFVHRLVQAVRRESMDIQAFRGWAIRVVRILDGAFPEGEFKDWSSREEQLFPHVQFCALWIEREALFIPEAGRLLRKAGDYLRRRMLYRDAALFLQGAQVILEQNLGTEHLDTASSLHSLAILSWEQGKYEKAGPLFRRALAIRERILGVEHRDTVRGLNNLGYLYAEQGQYEEAEPLLQRALAIREQRALAIREQRLGEAHPDTQATRKAYVALLHVLGRDAEARTYDKQ